AARIFGGQLAGGTRGGAGGPGRSDGSQAAGDDGGRQWDPTTGLPRARGRSKRGTGRSRRFRPRAPKAASMGSL
ncbi:MAG: hypothetical protein AVDCRST_MAG04-119, partial [uncultured Acetobacteraceae bacterium]